MPEEIGTEAFHLGRVLGYTITEHAEAEGRCGKCGLSFLDLVKSQALIVQFIGFIPKSIWGYLTIYTS